MKEALDDFFSFLQHAPTSFHASQEIANRLAQQEWTPLDEKEPWNLEPESGYFVQRDQSALLAFRLPKKKPRAASILATHLDSPSLKLKPIPEVHQKEGVTQFSTEIYGSPLLHTWFDRNLSLAGRVLLQSKKNQIESRLVHLDDYPLSIPSLAPHLDRLFLEKGVQIDKQEHLRPIVSLTQSHLIDWLKKHCDFKELISFDLFLSALEPPSFGGLNNEWIYASRLDNLSSAFAALSALSHQKSPEDHLQVALFWDHEEVGSETLTGAGSSFFSEALERIATSQHLSREEFFQLKAKSWCVSVDLAHASHPNFATCFDQENSPKLGKGVVLKLNAQQKYATSASTSARLIELCKKKKIALQTFASHSNLRTGSTVGPIMAANHSIPTLDIGVGGWAMHSIRETLAAADQIELHRLLSEILQNAPEG